MNQFNHVSENLQGKSLSQKTLHFRQKTINKQENRINIFLPAINLMIYLRDIMNDQYTYLRDLG